MVVVLGGTNKWQTWGWIGLCLLASVGGQASAEDGKAASRPGDPATRSTRSPADPAQLEFSKWSGEINVPDPVAISLDPQGRAYVTQTQRRKSQDLDIRANRDWIPFDVGFQTVDDKRNFYHQQLAIGGNDEEAAKHVDDMNGDGVHDWRDLTVLSERIHRLEDTDGDGTADRIGLFAEGFQTEVTGIAAGVLWHDGDVYATIAPDVWRLRDTDGDGRSDQRQVIAHGFGLHIAYAGHDMHGLTVGPDGKIYWSVGDKGINVTTPDGRQFAYPNQGGVMRCNPDGSDFEVYAHGLRNVQELAFDAYGNLFGVDNDADGEGEKERFVCIVPGMDAGWRCNFQYKQEGFCPWWDEGLWKPWFAGQPAYILPPISSYHDGPAGFAFNPGTALSPDYRDYFFMTEAPNGIQYAFRVEPAGASFRMIDSHQIGKGIPIVGINFGADGALYGVDWGGGYPLNQSGAVWKIDTPEHADSPIRKETEQILHEGFGELEERRLLSLLGHADQRVRLGAQFELVRGGAVAPLVQIVDRPQPETSLLAQVHAMWGLGQLARAKTGSQSSTSFEGMFGRWLAADEAELRCQAAKVIRDLPLFDGAKLLPLLADAEPRVRLHAAFAAARHPSKGLRNAAVRMIVANGGEDLYLRHAGMVALAACEDLPQLADHDDENVRLAAVVALRRQADPAVARFLDDASQQVVAEAARAIHDDFSIPAALPVLAERLGSYEPSNTAAILRSINANFRIGSDVAALRLARFAGDATASEPMRANALQALADWRTPPLLDRVDGRRRQLPLDERHVPADQLTEVLSRVMQQTEGDLKRLTVMAMRALDLPIEGNTLVQLVAAESVPANLRIEALRAIDRSDALVLRKAIDQGLRSRDESLRIAALEMLASIDPRAATEQVVDWLKATKVGAPQQAAVKLLGQLDTPQAEQRLIEELERLQAGQTPVALHLELLAAGREKASSSPRMDRLLAAYEAEREADFLSPQFVQFEACVEGGNAKAGEHIFRTDLAAQCTRCHKIGGKGSEVGPDLKGIAKQRDPKHLVRAMVEPSADIEKDYLSKTFLLFSGEIVQGIIQGEEDDEIVLVDNRGKEVRVPVDDIEEESEQRVSIMPPMHDVLTPEQIRDVVAFLATLK